MPLSQYLGTCVIIYMLLLVENFYDLISTLFINRPIFLFIHYVSACMPLHSFIHASLCQLFIHLSLNLLFCLCVYMYTKMKLGASMYKSMRKSIDTVYFNTADKWEKKNKFKNQYFPSPEYEQILFHLKYQYSFLRRT